jgi:hypothetical protein
MTWSDHIKKGKLIEDEFAENLKDVVKANIKQDLYEHWDIEGTLQGKRLRFDVKDMKKFNRKDKEPQDEMACVEYVGISGHPGWVRGKADAIAFKRKESSWLVVDRQSLWYMTKKKLWERHYSGYKYTGFDKEPYVTYDRSFYGKKDKFCWVPYTDIENLWGIKITNLRNKKASK